MCRKLYALVCHQKAATVSFVSHDHEATKMTPYEVVYGQQPLSFISYLPGTSKV